MTGGTLVDAERARQLTAPLHPYQGSALGLAAGDPPHVTGGSMAAAESIAAEGGTSVIAAINDDLLNFNARCAPSQRPSQRPILPPRAEGGSAV